MSIVTPSLNTTGLYTLLTPFPDISDKLYRCVAIRSFSDYLDLGESAFEKVYAPVFLDQATYDADAALGANIVTLVSPFSPTVLVPDTYITKYPDLEYVKYANVIISGALGAVPDTLDLSLLKLGMADLIASIIGVTPEIKLSAYMHGSAVTTAQHEINETARLAAVTNQSTDRARVIALMAENAALAAHIVDLEDALAALSTP